MKKTNTINLGGIIFHIEEDAFVRLRNYLNAIRSHFSTSEGQDEILTDIESRIAEIFQEKKINIITSVQVDDVIAIMGKPEEYGDEEETEFSETQPVKKKTKKVFRHPDDKVLGGVCGGLGAYFNVDPILFRLGFLFTIIIGGFGLLVYLILWLIAPLADSASDHLEMHGEPITAESIGKTVASKIEENVSSDNQSIVRKILSGFGTIFGFLIELIKDGFTVLGKIIKPLFGILLLVFGLCAAICLSMFLGFISGMPFGNEFQEMTFTLNSIFSFLPLPYVVIMIGFILFVGIPLFQIIYFGLRLLFNMAKQSNAVKGTLLSLWIMGLLFMIFFGFHAATYYAESARKEYDVVLEKVTSDTINLSLVSHDYFYWGERDVKVIESEDGEYRFSSKIRLDVRRSRDTSYHLLMEKIALANSYYDAKDFAENIKYSFVEDPTSIKFNQYFETPVDDPYQHQELKLTILVPTGKSVYLGEELKYFIYDIRNIHRMHDYEMVGHTWEMMEEGLACLNYEEGWTRYESNRFPKEKIERKIQQELKALDEEKQRLLEEIKEKVAAKKIQL